MGKRVRLTSGFVPRKCSKRGNYSEDRISQLPDEILVSILTWLTMREAIRTSVLSSSWRYLWTFSPVLNFDASKTFRELKLKHKLLKEEVPKYVSWVNQVLDSYQGPNIKLFRVCFDLDRSSEHAIDKWINFAFEKRVQRLELDLPPYMGGGKDKCYTFPRLSVRKLRPDICLARPIMFSKFESLRTLRLVYVDVSRKVLRHLLSACPFLERLYVKGSKCLVNLKVARPTLCLRYLEIYYCFSLEKIDIHATNLVSFKYSGPHIKLPFVNLPSLVEVSIGGKYCERFIYHNEFWKLSKYLLQLETLVLDVHSIQKNMETFEIPEFNNLKVLEVTVRARDYESLLAFRSLIKASPFLRKFVMRLDWVESSFNSGIRKVTDCPHECLKVVEFMGFVGRTNDVELVMYLLENAVSLEKMIIDVRDPYSVGKAWEFDETDQKQAARECGRQLKANLLGGSKLEVI